MKRIRNLLAAVGVGTVVGFLILLQLLVTMGCTPPGMVRAEPLLPVVERIVERHDQYAAVDSSLSPVQRRANKRDGVLVLKALRTSLEEDKEDTDEEE